MPRVLIATDEPNFTLGLVAGYKSLGWDVATGTSDFRNRAAQYDVVHHQWPEEFCGWTRPGSQQIEQIRSLVRWWEHRAVNIFTVNNLYPHEFDNDPACHELYSLFYRHCQLVTHYSEASHQLVLKEFPITEEVRHVVHAPANYEVTLANQRERGSRRAAMGIQDEEFVILMLGRLRSWDEIRLMQRAFDLTKVPRKRLLMAGKLELKDSRWGKLNKQLRLNWWLSRVRAVVDTSYVPENEISGFIDSCDVAIIPRLSGISSGIFNLAMTFGRAVVAPRHGAYPEYFVGTDNFLYETGSAESLAAALERAASVDLAEVGRKNAMIAAKWTWKRMVETCLAAVSPGDRLAQPLSVSSQV